MELNSAAARALYEQCCNKPNKKIMMPVKAKPYRHQIEAFNFVSDLLGIVRGGDENISISSRGSALLMEMQSHRHW